MRMRSILGALRVMACLGLAGIWLAGAASAAESPAPTPKDSPGKGSESAADRVEKQIEGIQERLMALQSDEFQVQMNVMKAVQAASQGAGDPANIRNELAKGNMKAEYRAYKQAMLAAANQWAALDNRYQTVAKSVKPLERELDQVPDPVKQKINDLMTKVQDKHRSNLERIADTYDKIADFKTALGIYLQVWQAIPEKKRAGERTLAEKIADLSERLNDWRSALSIRTGLFQAIPEKDRYKDRGQGERVGNCMEHVNDWAGALQLYRKLLEAIPPDKRNTDGKGLQDRIANCEKKLGGKAPAAKDTRTTGTQTDKKLGR